MINSYTNQRLLTYLITFFFATLTNLAQSNSFTQAIIQSLHSTKVALCTHDQQVYRVHHCGDNEKCWAWCYDQQNFASSLSQARGKWCYTTSATFFSGQGKACHHNMQCDLQKQCVTKCSADCWKSQQDENKQNKTVKQTKRTNKQKTSKSDQQDF